MIRAIIIEDKSTARELLAELINTHIESVKIVGMGESVDEGVKLIEKYNPDLIFLDIQMPGGNGFDLFKRVSNINFDIIFTTSYDKYAIQAFKVSAIDYLLKPIKLKELVEAVEKVNEKRKEKTPTNSIAVLKENISNENKQNHKIVLNGTGGSAIVSIHEIIRGEAHHNYSEFTLISGEKMMISKTLLDYEELLEPYDFMRIHRSHLVNLHHVRKYTRGLSKHVVMSDNSKVEISKRKSKEFLEVISRFQ